MPVESEFWGKSHVSVNLHIFWKNDTCTLIEELFRPVRLFFFEILSPCTIIKEGTFIRDVREGFKDLKHDGKNVCIPLTGNVNE